MVVWQGCDIFIREDLAKLPPLLKMELFDSILMVEIGGPTEIQMLLTGVSGAVQSDPVQELHESLEVKPKTYLPMHIKLLIS